MIPQELVTSPALDDAEVVRRVRGGEVALFEVLVRRHDVRVYRTVRSILRDEAEAEDSMQAAWLRAYQHLSEFRGAARFSTWLVRIAANEALMSLRRRRLAPVAPEAAAEEEAMERRTPDPEQHAAQQEAVRLLERAVDALPPTYRTVFVLREIEQLSTAETADALDIGEDAAKVRLSRAKAMLRRAVGEELGRAAPEAFPFLAPRCNRMVERVMNQLRDVAPQLRGVAPSGATPSGTRPPAE